MESPQSQYFSNIQWASVSALVHCFLSCARFNLYCLVVAQFVAIFYLQTADEVFHNSAQFAIKVLQPTVFVRLVQSRLAPGVSLRYLMGEDELREWISTRFEAFCANFNELTLKVISVELQIISFLTQDYGSAPQLPSPNATTAENIASATNILRGNHLERLQRPYNWVREHAWSKWGPKKKSAKSEPEEEPVRKEPRFSVRTRVPISPIPITESNPKAEITSKSESRSKPKKTSKKEKILATSVTQKHDVSKKTDPTTNPSQEKPSLQKSSAVPAKTVPELPPRPSPDPKPKAPPAVISKTLGSQNFDLGSGNARPTSASSCPIPTAARNRDSSAQPTFSELKSMWQDRRKKR